MKLRVLCFVLVLSCWSHSFAATETIPPLKQGELSVLEKKADGIIGAMLDGQASEYKAARTYKRLRTKKLGEKSVVIFTIEGFGGGNNYQIYLALFGASEDQFTFLDVIKIGEKTWRHVDFASVVADGNAIEMDTLEYEDSDANCCPSRKSKARYMFSGGRLSEVVRSAQRDAK